MAREDAQMKLRLPEVLKNWITKSAATNGRSMNAEIVSRLEAAMSIEEEYGDVREIIGELSRDLEQIGNKVDILWSEYHGRDPYNDDK